MMVPGSSLAHYTLLARLGGGMGEVFLAQDTRLDRTVALKTLRPELAANPDRMRRFAREARAVAALNHPHVAQIHDFGECEGTWFIAMEYVEGEVLSRLFRSGPLEVGLAVDIALQLCDALVYAHSQGITHRDLKPGNIMLTPQREVKLLDFGLANLERPEASRDADTVASPGPWMGKIEYLSPEQAAGDEVDGRADLFSLGAVLYEALTGKRAFDGGTRSEVYDAILHRNPAPPRLLNPRVAESLERIVLKALEKDRELRYQAVSDLRADLRRVRRDVPWPGPAPAPALPAADPRWRVRVAALLVLAMVATGGWLWVRRRSSSDPKEWNVGPLTTYPGSEAHPSFSPDGNQVAFAWSGENEENWDLYTKVIGPGSPLRLTSHPGLDLSPAWSPDGSQIAFFRQTGDDGAFLTIPASGGMERKIAAASPGRVGAEAPYLAWGPDSRTLVVSDRDSGEQPLSLWLMDCETGQRRRLTRPPASSLGDSTPSFSPDGKSIAFTRTLGISVQDIYIIAAAGGPARRITFDNRRVYGLTWNTLSGSILFASNRGANSRLWRIWPRGGEPERIGAVGENASFLAGSAASRRVAYTRISTDTNIWRYPIPGRAPAGAQPVRWIASTRHEQAPQYSPDGDRIAFSSNRSGAMEVWVADWEGQNPTQLTFFAGPAAGSPHWSSDGRTLAFDARPDGNADVYTIAGEGGSPRRLTTHPAEDIVPSWSRDGKWIYFGSNRSGRYELWKLPAAGGAEVQVTKEGGFHGRESADGKWLYYVKSMSAPGLWRMPSSGGNEEPVLPSLKPGYWGYWALSGATLYYLDRDDVGDRPRYAVRSLDVVTRRGRTVCVVPKRPFNSGLSVSPDSAWLLLTQVDSADTDAVLVDNVR